MLFKNDKIAVIIKSPKQQPKVDYITNDVAMFKRIVNGQAKLVPYSNRRYMVENVFCIVNREHENLPLNFMIGDKVICGNAIFVSRSGNGSITGLSDYQMDLISKIYDSQVYQKS
jgi:hypothetical protein